MVMKIAAAVLAAGRSERFGDIKVLQKIEGKTFLEIIFEKLEILKLDTLLVYYFDEIADFVPSDIRMIKNSYPEEGQIHSIKLAIAELLNEDYDGLIVWPADMPLIDTGTVRGIVDRALEEPRKIIAASYKGSIGHPVYFPRRKWMEIFEIHNSGVNVLVHTPETVLTETDDHFTKIGVNTKEELEKYIDEYKKGS